MLQQRDQAIPRRAPLGRPHKEHTYRLRAEDEWCGEVGLGDLGDGLLGFWRFHRLSDGVLQEFRSLSGCEAIHIGGETGF